MYLFPDRRTIIAVGSLKVYWYGFLYVVSFIAAFFILPRLQRYRGFTKTSEEWLSLITWSALGVLLGGRLGYIVLYEPAYFLAHPGQILAIWTGGMASHGGFLGVALVIWLISRKWGVPFLSLTDLVVVPTGIGLALGRVGNSINQEFYPYADYAVVKDLLGALIGYYCLRHTRRPGYPTAVFIIFYSTLRFFLEFLREPLHPVWKFNNFIMTKEQLLTAVLASIGLGLLLWLFRQQEVPPPPAGRKTTR